MYVLMIFDGWGLSDNHHGNAISQANTPNMDRWMKVYPWTRLQACCEHVGLPAGQMGNSEVGHLNIGAGRVVYSPLMRINKAIEKGNFQRNEVLLNAMKRAKSVQNPIHLLGMVSDGGVHSHINHLFALIEMAENLGTMVVVHVLLDGRDTGPRVAESYLVQLEKKLAGIRTGGRIADITGRYYTMDRDKRWDRIKLGYDALVLGEGERAPSAVEALRAAYARDEGDEFVHPTVICPDGENPVIEDLIGNGDDVIFLNFRPDRARQVSHALIDENFTYFKRENIRVNMTSIMKYEDSLATNIAFPPISHMNVLGEVIAGQGLKQLRITETEKYAHITFFLNGGREEPFPGEERILIPSPRVATYDLQPEMSAPVITDRLLEVLNDFNVVMMNFANCDMVGHTGFMGPAIRAVETVDRCAGRVVEAVLERKGTVLITADHGNAEATQGEDGGAITAHTLNPVPLIWISEEAKEFRKEGVELNIGAITDIAPTLLRLMDVPVPGEMTSPSIIPDEYFKDRVVI